MREAGRSYDPTSIVGTNVNWMGGNYKCTGYHNGPVFILQESNGHSFCVCAGDVKPLGHRMVDCGGGFFAVHPDAVAVNGVYLPQCDTGTGPLVGRCHLIAPNGRAVEGELGRPHLYSSVGDAKADAMVLGKAAAPPTGRHSGRNGKEPRRG